MAVLICIALFSHAATARLVADNQINLTAAQNTATQSTSTTSSSASIGVGFSLGTRNGVTFNASANQASGNGAGQELTHTHSAVTAGKVLINAGGDTHIKGATVTGNTVTARVGGELNITQGPPGQRVPEHQQPAGR